MNLDELLSVDPDVTPISDQRVRFYLDNRQIIDTWARLRDETATALHERLLDLADTLSEDLEQLGVVDAEVAAVDADKGTPRVQLVRRAWSDSSGFSPVAVVVEWTRTVIDRRGDLQVYVGLRSKLSHPRSNELIDPLAAIGNDLKTALGKPWQGKRGRYPLWRWIRPDGGALDEAVLVAQARREIWHCWTASAPRIDGLLAH